MRYPLLLHELLEQCAEDAELAGVVAQAEEVCTAVAQEVNNAMKDQASDIQITVTKEHLDRMESNTQERIKAIEQKVHWYHVYVLLFMACFVCVWIIGGWVWAKLSPSSSSAHCAQVSQQLSACLQKLAASSSNARQEL